MRGPSYARLSCGAVATLYRCRTPTNWLCPCGRVERALRKAGVEHDTERVAWRKRDRDDVEELSGQRHVPLLVTDDEAICDSKRIVEYVSSRGRSASASDAGRP
jgi:glutathione S-transferase